MIQGTKDTGSLVERSHLEEMHNALVERRSRLLGAFSQATEKRQNRRIRRLCRQIEQINEFLGSLEQIKSETRPLPNPSVPRYVVSSLFLVQCFKELTADADEQLFYITGPEVDGVLVLDHKLEFAHRSRSVVGVVGDTRATHRLLIKLAQFGHRLLAHFHSHPGRGALATDPSGIDQDFQRRLESGGYPAVAAVFSRDGYIRFFRLDHRFEIEIHGTGVEHLGDQVYRLAEIHSPTGEEDSRC